MHISCQATFSNNLGNFTCKDKIFQRRAFAFLYMLIYVRKFHTTMLSIVSLRTPFANVTVAVKNRENRH